MIIGDDFMVKMKKFLAVVTACALTLPFAGCNDKKMNADESFGETYPLKTETTLSYWMAINENVTASVSTFAETEYAKEAEKKTGVKIDYRHPVIGSEAEQFNLLIASGELPDVIEYGWYEFPGGPGKAIDDGYIIPLNDYIDKYAPNLKKYLKENPDIDKAIKTDDGRYYVFPFIRGDEKLLLSAGPIVRVDLLEKLGIEAPVTYDDWYNMLVKFKENGVKIPLCFNATNTWEIQQLLATFGAQTGYYVDGDKVKFGPFDPEFKTTLEMLSKWYKEGLLDKNFTTSDSKIRDSNVLLGKTGVTYGSGGGQLGKWISSLPKGSDIKLGTLTYPVANADSKGAKYKAISLPYPGMGAAVTTSCKNPALAIKYLDYFYGEEGHILTNFGIEGKSYTMKDNKPTYTEEITKNPKGLSMSQAMAMYLRAYSSGPFVQDVGYIEQYYALDEQQQALNDWCKGNDYAMKHQLPSILCTGEEASEMSEITNNINTYRDNMILKFITGQESFDKYDNFVSQMKKFNADRATEIQQAAYERYKKR